LAYKIEWAYNIEDMFVEKGFIIGENFFAKILDNPRIDTEALLPDVWHEITVPSDKLVGFEV
jgi:hypothetical protein